MDPERRAACIEGITAIHELSARALMKVFGSDGPLMIQLVAPLTQQAAARVPPPTFLPSFSAAATAGPGREVEEGDVGHMGAAGGAMHMQNGGLVVSGEGSHQATVDAAVAMALPPLPHQAPIYTPAPRPVSSSAPNVPVKWSKACNSFIDWLYPERVKAVSTAYAYSHALGELIEQFRKDQTAMFTSEQDLKDFVRVNDPALRSFLPFPAKRPPRARTAYRAFYLYMTGEDLWWDEGPLFQPHVATPSTGGGGGSASVSGSEAGSKASKPRQPRAKPKPRFTPSMGEQSEAHLAKLVESVGRERDFTDNCMRIIKKLVRLDEEKKLLKIKIGENPEYDERVRRVMSFLRMKTKLKNGLYDGSYEAFRKDVELLWDNTNMFFGPNHQLSIMVETKMKPLFEPWYNRMLEREARQYQRQAGEASGPPPQAIAAGAASSSLGGGGGGREEEQSMDVDDEDGTAGGDDGDDNDVDDSTIETAAQHQHQPSHHHLHHHHQQVVLP